jgi:hypothetical protein
MARTAHTQRWRRLLLAAVAAGLLAGVSPAAAAPGVQGLVSQPVVGESWAGYDVIAAAPTAGFTPYFTRVSGDWIEPAAACASVKAAQASFWVGLGGALDTSATYGPLQIGADSDCVGGHASYLVWYEAFPEPVVTVAMRVRPGNLLSASVSLNSAGNPVVALRDETTGAAFARTLSQIHLQPLATDSAEWIVEGPYYRHPPLLAGFGHVDFSDATATQVGPNGSHTGPIVDPAWRYSEPDILSGDESGVYEPRVEQYAAPTALNPAGDGFTVGFGPIATGASFIDAPQ